MISPQALHTLLDDACRKAAGKAALRIEGYDLEKVEKYLNMMEQGVPGWKHSEIIATLEARTISGCPDPENQEQLDIMRQCFSEAVQETANRAPLQ